MALGDPFASRTLLKDRLGIAADDTSLDARCDDVLAAVTSEIIRVCGRQFADAGSVSARLYQPTSECLAYVDDFSTTTGLIIETGASGPGVFEATWTSTDYQLEPLNGIVDGETGWPFWRIRAIGARYFPSFRWASLRVTARWGWAAVPAPVREACLIVSQETFKLPDAPFGVAGFGDFGPVRVRQNPIAMAKLQKYVLRGVKVR